MYSNVNVNDPKCWCRTWCSHTKTAKMKQVFAIVTTTKRYKTMSQKIAKAQVKYNNPEKSTWLKK